MKKFSEVIKIMSTEIKLSKLQIEIFLLILKVGKMNVNEIASKTKTNTSTTLFVLNSLVELGGLINFNDNEFETMHPRFTIVNMYRNTCKKYGIKFGMNKKIDNLGMVLEDYYYKARTKN
ncbi:MAG: hypothetical protein OXF28_04090 [Thaumarchaeota archaeon]|nr:hypothetical protein [Nitrososphaerota archaeon]MCY3976292.1 hypothetical protein [Nitrososphaerota archaeon]